MGRRPLPKSRKDNEAKKRLWAERALVLFQRGGLADLTMEDIAAYLKKSKSTLYEYFPSKDEIILQALLSRLAILSGYHFILTDKSRSHVGRYKAFLNFMLENIGDISGVFLLDLQKHFPPAWQALSAFLEGLLGHLDEYHQGGIEAGEFKRLSVPLMVRMDGLFLSEVLMQPGFLLEHGLSLHELVRQYVLLKFEGVLELKN